MPLVGTKAKLAGEQNQADFFEIDCNFACKWSDKSNSVQSKVIVFL